MWPTLTRTAGAVAVTAAAGGVAGSGADSRWYRRLDKPPFQPPPVAFPVVWTALYADIAVTTAAALDRLDGPQRAALTRALALNLGLNASWTWVFFRFHRLPAATAVAALLTLSSADLARRSGRALAPYAAWCAFATLLSAEIWRRNR